MSLPVISLQVHARLPETHKAITHEFGHNMGHPDAYAEGKGNPPLSSLWAGNQMAVKFGNGTIDKTNIRFLANWALQAAQGSSVLVVDEKNKPKPTELPR